MKKASRNLTNKFCRCIKGVRRKTKEGIAIAICTKSVLQTRGKTLKKFKCRDNKLFTQPKKS